MCVEKTQANLWFLLSNRLRVNKINKTLRLCKKMQIKTKFIQ